MDNSVKVGGLSLLAVLGLGARFLARAGRAMHHSTPSASSFRSSDLQRLSQDFEARQAQRQLDDAVAEGKRVLESTVERSCVTTSRRRYLEPQGTSLGSLFRSSRRINAPADVRVPSASMVMGLPVMVMTKSGAEVRWCADANDTMANDLAKDSSTWPVEKVAPGAWVLHTEPEQGLPASTALVSAAFLRQLGPASLVALAPTDHTIALADASKPEAIRAAAKRLAPLIDTELTDGVLQAQPLVLKNGTWSEWKPAQLPPEVAAVKKLGEVAERRMVLDQLEAFPRPDELESWNLLGAGLPPIDLRAAELTELRVEGQRTTVVVDATLEEPLFVVQADTVELTEVGTPKTLTWQAFTMKYAAQLEPVTVDGSRIPWVQRFVPAVSR